MPGGCGGEVTPLAGGGNGKEVTEEVELDVDPQSRVRLNIYTHTCIGARGTEDSGKVTGLHG